MVEELEKRNNKNFIHFMMVPFTGLGLHKGFRGNAWFKNRIEIFKNYTLKSLLNQTNKDFVLWISFRPQERRHPLVRELSNYLSSFGLRYIFTFGGLMFWDDKYISDSLWKRLDFTLPQLKRIVGDKSYVYETIQPSDDMYSRDAVEMIQREVSLLGIGAVGFDEGYILNGRTHELAKYNPDTNPPFYTIKFDSDTFLDPKKHYEYIKNVRSHEYVPEVFNYKVIPGRYFCVLVHGENISTTWNIPYKGKEVYSPTKDDILQGFGITKVKPLKYKLSMHLTARIIFNFFPLGKYTKIYIRKVYHRVCSGKTAKRKSF